MSFGTPLALLGLLVVPVVVVLLVIGERRRRAQGAAFGTPALVAASLPAPRRVRRLLPFALALVALSALIVGVARPRATLSVPGRQATVILALDTSRSMSATDVKPSRLAAALAAARAFLDVAPEELLRRHRLVLDVGVRRARRRRPTATRRGPRSTRSGSARERRSATRSIARSRLRAGTERRRSRRRRTPHRRRCVLLSDGEQTSGTATRRSGRRRRRQEARRPRQHGRARDARGRRRGAAAERAQGAGDRRARHEDAARRSPASRAAGTPRLPTAERLEQVYRDLGSRLGKKREEREVTAAFAGVGVVLLLVASGLSLAWTRRPL